MKNAEGKLTFHSGSYHRKSSVNYQFVHEEFAPFYLSLF
jgi:hypothetical protein